MFHETYIHQPLPPDRDEFHHGNLKTYVDAFNGLKSRPCWTTCLSAVVGSKTFREEEGPTTCRAICSSLVAWFAAFLTSEGRHIELCPPVAPAAPDATASAEAADLGDGQHS